MRANVEMTLTPGDVKKILKLAALQNGGIGLLYADDNSGPLKLSMEPMGNLIVSWQDLRDQPIGGDA